MHRYPDPANGPGIKPTAAQETLLVLLVDEALHDRLDVLAGRLNIPVENAAAVAIARGLAGIGGERNRTHPGGTA